MSVPPAWSVAEGGLPGGVGGFSADLLEMRLVDLLVIQKAKSRRKPGIYLCFCNTRRAFSQTGSPSADPPAAHSVAGTGDALLSGTGGPRPPTARPAELQALWATSVAGQTGHCCGSVRGSQDGPRPGPAWCRTSATAAAFTVTRA